jgi:hypothetical protein
VADSRQRSRARTARFSSIVGPHFGSRLRISELHSGAKKTQNTLHRWIRSQRFIGSRPVARQQRRFGPLRRAGNGPMGAARKSPLYLRSAASGVFLLVGWEFHRAFRFVSHVAIARDSSTFDP